MANPAFTPLVNRDTEPFWNACTEKRLLLQRCSACDTFRHPPSPVCHACHATAHEWRESGGRGTVWSYTVLRERVEGWPGALPLVVVIVQLDEGVKLISNLLAEPDAVRIGQTVEVCFEPGPEGITLPLFRPI
jgi:uncharacterized OB-fold protein